MIFVGMKNAEGPEVFRFNAEPTAATHGSRYSHVVGPFRTVRGARFMVSFGQNNPHCRCVGDAERLAQRQA
jgi:hypothetical protein